jgi:hypothetical protein
MARGKKRKNEKKKKERTKKPALEVPYMIVIEQKSDRNENTPVFV